MDINQRPVKKYKPKRVKVRQTPYGLSGIRQTPSPYGISGTGYSQTPARKRKVRRFGQTQRPR